jgi:single-strand DNA-binding protein
MSDTNSLKITGPIVVLGEIETITTKSGKAFKKAQVVIEIPGQKYNGRIPFVVSRKALDDYGHLRVNDVVTVYFNLSGREWNGRWFVELDAWRIAREGADQRESGTFDPATDLQDVPPLPDSERADADGEESYPF